MPRSADNPLLSDWREADQFPPLAKVCPGHFHPAVERLAEARLARIDEIAGCADPATFENTVVAFEEAGGHLERVEALFEIFRLTVATPELRAVEPDVSVLLARHRTQAFRHEGFFHRLDDLYRRRDAIGLAEDERRLLERLHLDYVRTGIALDDADGAQLVALKSRLAELDVAFNRNLAGATEAFRLELSNAAELAGLPDFVCRAAQRGGSEAHPPCHVFTLRHSSVTAFLTFSSRRDLREKIWRAWTGRGKEAEFDNRGIAREIVTLRLALSRLLGYRSYADYALQDRMAATPDAALSLLHELWEPARRLCRQELKALVQLAEELGEPADIEPWDWRYLTEKLKARTFHLDAERISRHFALESVIAAAFECASRLFGLSFHARIDVPLYHSDARWWEVRREGRTIGHFIADYVAREGKQSGAWESEFRMQSRGRMPMLPIVINSASFSHDPGRPTLLGIDDVETLFHEFGHALHCLLSDVRFSGLSGTRVARDFVEFPSHLFENWALQPEVLARHAMHIETGEPLPADTIAQLRKSRVFNEGFELVRYIAPAVIDIELHRLEAVESLDVDAFEAVRLAALGAPREADVNMHLPQFRHIFSEDAYAAGYYGYLWAQVLEADAFNAFEDAGSPFDPAVARRLNECLLSIGNARDAGAAFRRFRHRAPDPAALARKRGVATLSLPT